MGSKRNPGKFDCHAAAEPDEPMFVLLGRDPTAWLVTDFWRALRSELGVTSTEKLKEAEQCSQAMRTWAKDLGKDTGAATRALDRAYTKLRARMMAEESQRGKT